MLKPKIYMAVTSDSLELPLFVGSSREVANWAGISVSTLYSQVYLKMNGKKLGRKFVAVDDEDEGEGEDHARYS